MAGCRIKSWMSSVATGHLITETVHPEGLLIFQGMCLGGIKNCGLTVKKEGYLTGRKEQVNGCFWNME